MESKLSSLQPRRIVSKRRGSIYRGGESRDWLNTKCHETGIFAITGFSELGEGRLEAIYVAEARDGELRAAGQVRFGFAGKGLWHTLKKLRADPSKGASSRCSSGCSRGLSSSADTKPAISATA